MAATLLALYKRPEGGDEALATFWQRYRDEHMPLIEKVPGPARHEDLERVARATPARTSSRRARCTSTTRDALKAAMRSDEMRVAGDNLNEFANGLLTLVACERMTVHYDVEGRVATVRLDRPEVFNALNRATLDGDPRLVRQSVRGPRRRRRRPDRDRRPRLLHRRGPRRAEGVPDRPNDYWDWMSRFIEAIEAIKDCAKPVVARLNGMVVGGGNELNIACDLAIAADDVVFRHVGPSRGSLPCRWRDAVDVAARR